MQGSTRLLRFVITVLGLLALPLAGVIELAAQEFVRDSEQNESGRLILQKTAQSREYQGREIEGEERRVGPGDSIWRILVKEKGLPENRFNQYLVIIRGLNPKIQNINVLRVGESIFIPLRPDESLTAPAATAKTEIERSPLARGATKDYRVKPGEHLYQILREQLDVSNDREVAQYYALVKDLNPERKNWDALLGGDMIRLPSPGKSTEITTTERKSPATVESTQASRPLTAVDPPAGMVQIPSDKSSAPRVLGLDYARRLPARENLALLRQVIEVLGNQVRSEGQETLNFTDGTVRVDRAAYPVVYNPKLHQRIILDPDEKIPSSLKSKLKDPAVAATVVPLTRAASLQESVSQLLAHLGYQSLPAERPVVIQDAGVAIEARGNWMALAPEEKNKAQEVVVVTLTDDPRDIPDYLRRELSARGLHLKDILVSGSSNQSPDYGESTEPVVAVKHWPREKGEFVDAVLLAFGVPFGVAEIFSVELGQGLRADVHCDRILERNGKRTGLFFQRLEPEIKKALQEREKIQVVELALSILPHKEIMARLSTVLGAQAVYREHRFSASSSKDRLNISAWGFLLANRGLFVTDREIPQSLHRFFFEKGLEIVYFD
jgi:hypothetical protein